MNIYKIFFTALFLICLSYQANGMSFVQKVKKISVDCDGDCLLIQVKQIGGAACHTGMRSCFYRKTNTQGELVVEGKKIFDPKKVYKK